MLSCEVRKNTIALGCLSSNTPSMADVREAQFSHHTTQT